MLATTFLVGPEPKQVMQQIAKVTYPNRGQYYRSILIVQLKKTGLAAEYNVKKSVDYRYSERF
jgi:hypothetical protein